MSVILNILKAIPAILSLLEGFKSFWENWQVSQIKKHYDKKRKARSTLINKMEIIRTKEPFDEEAYKRLTRDLAIIDSIY